ncbi:MAG TPA: hypothetical protein VLH37_07280 [Bacteroidales bacterium]|nr:hypothetical protein [Bacteroidales bacterium]
MSSIPDPDRIFSIASMIEFEGLALDIFRYQFSQNAVYRSFCLALNKNPENVYGLIQIPFLPISAFQNNRVVSFEGKEKIMFTSSGTTGSIPSKHFVLEPSLYERSFTEGFRRFYGDAAEYCIMALLPGYLERSDSSLVYMVDNLMRRSGHPESGFFLNNPATLAGKLEKLHNAGEKILLIGVSFALLDLAEQYPVKIPNAIIMETGGMKGRREEIVRELLHEIISKAFEVESIHSEYGMTELLSQAYSTGQGLFDCPPWMKVAIRDINDPQTYVRPERTGGINVIDLANLHSCSFIATQDLGRVLPNGQFEVLGRFDHSDTRGCNLMVS